MKTKLSYRIQSGITYFSIWLFGGAKHQREDETEARDTNERTSSDKSPLIRCGETYSAWQ